MGNVLFAFILGMMFGAGMFIAYSWYHVNNLRKAKGDLLEKFKAKATALESVKDRLIKASEIATAQMSIRAQMEAPSKNALHSRWKNGLVGEMQELEAQKLDILKSILAEGINPPITVINESGVKSEIPLSTYVDEAMVSLNASYGSTPPPPPTDPEQPRKAGKFIVYKGGKDDGTTH